MKSFDCDRCGACCRNIRRSKLSTELDRGDGVCKHLSEENLCAIYATRPLICNVAAYWERYLSSAMSREEFYRLNHAACERLKEIDSASQS